MKRETFQECTKKAFEYFGGIPQTVLYDNLKSVIIQRDKYGKNQHEFNDNFLDFAKTYKFIPKLCKPYRAQTKGKVERFNNYLKGNFYRPLKAKLKDNGIKYETSSIVITTNSSFIRLKEVFNDNEALTTAILDRLIHHRLLTFRVKALG